MIKLIVGLGNPGARYQKTRHNAGFGYWISSLLPKADGWPKTKNFRASTAKSPSLISPYIYSNR